MLSRLQSIYWARAPGRADWTESEVQKALAKGNRNSRAVGRAGGLGHGALAALMLATTPAWADRPDPMAADPLADVSNPHTASPAASPVPLRKVDRLLELVVAYLDNAFDAGRRAHRDTPRDAAPERIADNSGQ